MAGATSTWPRSRLSAILRPRDALAEPDPVVAAISRQGMPVAAVRAAHDGQHEGRVLDRAGHGTEMGHRAEGAQGPGRDTTEGGLEADDAAEAGRHPDRAAAVGADMEGAHAQRRGDRRPAARPAGRPAGVPGVAGDLAQRVVGHRLPAQLRRRGLAEQHGPLLAQAGDRGASSVSGAGSPVVRLPRRVGQPLARMRSLTVVGTPSTRPAGSPLCQRASEARAAAMARSSSTRQKAPTSASSRAMRSRQACVTSTGETVFVR